ncbi:MAG: COX15/CtaA family protein [Mycobacteriales bacterium]
MSDTPIARLGRLPTLARVLVVAQIAIAVTGGIVRLTSSGLGCPTWPDCSTGRLTPGPAAGQGWHQCIEFGNRTLAIAVGLLAAVMTFAALRRSSPTPTPSPPSQRRPVVAWALIQLLGVPAEAALGGATVLSGLNPLLVAAHLLLSMLLIAAAVVLLDRCQHPVATLHRVDGAHIARVPPTALARWINALSGLTAAVVIIGTLTVGAGPHSGAPGARRLPLNLTAVTGLHAALGITLLGTAALVWTTTRAWQQHPPELRRRSGQLLAVASGQVILGHTQYLTGLPAALITIHILGAALLVIALTRLRIAAQGDHAATDAAHPSLVTTA